MRLDSMRWAIVGYPIAYLFGLLVCSVIVAARTRDAKFVLFAALSALTLAISIAAIWVAVANYGRSHSIFVPSLLVTFGGLWMTATVVMNVAAESQGDSRDRGESGESDGPNDNPPAPSSGD